MSAYKGPVELEAIWNTDNETTVFVPVSDKEFHSIYGGTGVPAIIYPENNWLNNRLRYPESNEDHELILYAPFPGDVFECWVTRTRSGRYIAKPAMKHRVA